MLDTSVTRVPSDGSPLRRAHFSGCRLPPSSATVVVRTPILQLEDSGEEGRRLSLVFQLLDSADRTIVNTDNLRAVAVVQHPNTAAVPFSACHLTGTGGIGICEGTLSSALFPGPGQATSANVVLEVYTGWVQACSAVPRFTVHRFVAWLGRGWFQHNCVAVDLATLSLYSKWHALLGYAAACVSMLSVPHVPVMRITGLHCQ